MSPHKNYDSDCHSCGKYDSDYSDDCCGKYSKYDSDSCHSSSSSDCHKKKRRRRSRRKSYCRPPRCCKPAFGKKVSAKLCPCKVVDAVDCSCAYGYANFCLCNDSRRAKWCARVYDLKGNDKYVCLNVHRAAPGEANTECNLKASFKLRRYKYATDDGYGNDCACKLLWGGSGTWSCDDKCNPLTPCVAELLACGYLNAQVNNSHFCEGEVRGQLCDYDDECL